MMNPWKVFLLCKKIALLKKDGIRDFYIGAIGIRNDGVIVGSPNLPVKIANNNNKSFFREAHAEFRLVKKLDHNATIYVARVNVVGSKFMNARPCRTCENALRGRRVKKVYYTISENTYGVMDL